MSVIQPLPDAFYSYIGVVKKAAREDGFVVAAILAILGAIGLPLKLVSVLITGQSGTSIVSTFFIAYASDARLLHFSMRPLRGGSLHGLQFVYPIKYIGFYEHSRSASSRQVGRAQLC